MPIDRETAYAVSSSEETAKSTSSRPARQSWMYSTFDVRITVVAFGASIRAKEHATRFTSSRDVQAMNSRPCRYRRPASAFRLAPFASIVRTS